MNGRQHSFVITRGSVPIFWSQTGIGSTKLYEDTNITRSTEMTKPAFTKHIESMLQDYSVVLAVDLLKDENERESRLTKEYYKQFFSSEFKEKEQLHFVHFDFHRLCKGDDFSPLKVLLQQLQTKISEFGWLIVDINEQKVVQKQMGV